MLRKQDIYESKVWPRWMKMVKKSPQHIIFLHGIMGSELYDDKNDHTRWLDLDIFMDMKKLAYEVLSPDGAVDCDDQRIYARSTVRPPIVKRPYKRFCAALKPGRFSYDWRESMPIEAQRLQKFLQILRSDFREPLTFITHSMGGCLLLYLLCKTDEFDDAIANIIFCAPPFHGALKPVRVIENGDGTPVNALINNSVLQKTTATMPGLFQLMVAPPEGWVSQIEGGPKLQYPIRADVSPYSLQFWTNTNSLELRGKILQFAKDFHQTIEDNTPDVIERLGNKIQVIVALHGKTLCSLTREDGQSIVHSVAKPDDGKVANGDGTVLFQSSILPGLPTEQYWADIPASQKDTHGSLVDSPDVIQAMMQLLRQQQPSKLLPYAEFIQRIDWSREEQNAKDPKRDEQLDYSERALMRSRTPVKKWGSRLNPGGRDALLFHITREAALRVLAGEDLQVAARQIGQTPEFLEEHIQQLLMPMLF